MDAKTALLTLLGNIDYEKGACRITEPIAAILPVDLLRLVRSVAEDESSGLPEEDCPYCLRNELHLSEYCYREIRRRARKTFPTLDDIPPYAPIPESYEFEKFHPRAVKLLRKRKTFIVIAVDEPYFIKAFDMIRQYEKRKGTWTKDDDFAFMRDYEEHAKIMEGIYNK